MTETSRELLPPALSSLSRDAKRPIDRSCSLVLGWYNSLGRDVFGISLIVELVREAKKILDRNIHQVFGDDDRPTEAFGCLISPLGFRSGRRTWNQVSEH